MIGSCTIHWGLYYTEAPQTFLYNATHTEKKSLWLNSNDHTYSFVVLNGVLDGAIIADDAVWYFFFNRCLLECHTLYSPQDMFSPPIF